jgi:hypothetical protein
MSTEDIYENFSDDRIYKFPHFKYISRDRREALEASIREKLRKKKGTNQLYVNVQENGMLDYEEDLESSRKRYEEIWEAISENTSRTQTFSYERFQTPNINFNKRLIILDQIFYEIQKYLYELDLLSKFGFDPKTSFYLDPEVKIPIFEKVGGFNFYQRNHYRDVLDKLAFLKLQQNVYLNASPYENYFIQGEEKHVKDKTPLHEMFKVHLLLQKTKNSEANPELVIFSIKEEDYRAFVNSIRETVNTLSHHLMDTLDEKMELTERNQVPPGLRI